MQEELLKEEEILNQKEETDGVTPTPSDEVVDSQSEQLDSEEPQLELEAQIQQPQQPQPRMFSQEEVNDMVGKTRQEARDKALRGFYERYGVDNDDELNDIFGRGQAYSILNDNFNDQGNQLKQVMAENALLKSNIRQDRWDDVKLILGGKGLEINPENIAIELETHPEWMGAEAQATIMTTEERPFTKEMGDKLINTPKQSAPAHPSVIRKFGTDVPKTEGPTEEEVVNKLFGI